MNEPYAPLPAGKLIHKRSTAPSPSRVTTPLLGSYFCFRRHAAASKGVGIAHSPLLISIVWLTPTPFDGDRQKRIGTYFSFLPLPCGRDSVGSPQLIVQCSS